MTDRIELTLLRHGRSQADDEGVFEGRYDSALTEVGRSQARLRAEGWRGQGRQFDRIIHSTLQRARATAEIIGSILGAPLEPDPNWMEMDHGPLAGLAFAEAEQRYPRPAFRGPYEAVAGSGESEVDLHVRAALAVQAVVRRGPGRYLVVAHGGILNAAMREILGGARPINLHGAWFGYSDLGYISLTYAPARHVWTVREMNTDDLLPPPA